MPNHTHTWWHDVGPLHCGRQPNFTLTSDTAQAFLGQGPGALLRGLLGDGDHHPNLTAVLRGREGRLHKGLRLLEDDRLTGGQTAGAGVRGSRAGELGNVRKTLSNLNRVVMVK